MKHYLSLLLLCLTITASAQYKIEPAEGYTPKVGELVDMLETNRQQITETVQGLSLAQTDFRFDEEANSIGALLAHLAATEAYYQMETLGGEHWTDEDTALWGSATGLGPASREEFKGKPISFYLEQWDRVRQKTLEGLKTRDDAWLSEDIDEDVNNYFAWFHVLDHAANHMGQIALIKERLPE